MPGPAPRNDVGILLMALGFFTFATIDTGSKLLAADFHPLQVAWVRQAGFLISVLIFLAIRRAPFRRSARPGLQVLRGVLTVGASVAFVSATRFVPLADAFAVSFVAPFFVTLLAAVVLREAVGVRRLVAVVVGFAGSLIILRPGLGVVHPAAFFVLLAAFQFALLQIVSRVLASVDDTRTTAVHSAVVACVLATVALPFVWTWPQGTKVILLMCMVAALAGVAEFLIIRALEVAEASALAPVHYSVILWGTMWGYLVFDQLPDFWTWVGTAIVVASGLYTINRERRLARKARLAAAATGRAL